MKGPDEKPERPGMVAALRALDARVGQPDLSDRPPVSVFPMTPAAAEALRLDRRNKKPAR